MTQAASTPDPFRGLERLHHWWRRLAAAVFPALGPTEAERATARLLGEFDELLKESRSHRGGEVSARKRAERIAAIYRRADIRSRAAMLNLITRDFAPDRGALERAIATLQAARDEVELSRAEARLRLALDAPRAKCLAQLSLLPEGVKFLLDLRADLLALLPQEPALEVLRVELDGLLGSWFDPGFLELRRITWYSPALVLEKLIAYEAVHPIESWNDLRNRLDTDRRCYAFFHPRLSNEPLIFVEVALLKGLPENVQRLLDQSAPAQDPGGADTAVFYSISNTHKGLRGISFGNLLLKRVIEDLRRELPRLSMFATLSPIPGFRKWLDERFAKGNELLPSADIEKFVKSVGYLEAVRGLTDALARSDWPCEATLAEALREPMEKLCARYLLREKSGNLPLDPVARFHLNNGARLDRIYWLADSSARGTSQSYGMMASYRYVLDELDANHERFLNDGYTAAARRVLRLLD